MKVILFDGVCNLCNSSVNWIIDHDVKDQFKFASLQSDYGINTINHFGLNGDYMNTVLLIEDEKIFSRSTAVLRIALALGFPYNLAYIYIIIPSFIRNLFYDFVARNRYKWFGKRDTCRMPDAGLKSKFLE